MLAIVLFSLPIVLLLMLGNYLLQLCILMVITRFVNTFFGKNLKIFLGGEK